MTSLSCTIPPEMLHSLVSAFFDSKKALVKQRLRDSMEAIVDDLFSELVGQVKEMFLPKTTEKNTTSNARSLLSEHKKLPSAFDRPTSKQTGQKSPKSQRQVFAVKSAPGASSQPAGGGLKRPHEPVTVTKSIISPASDQGLAPTPITIESLISDHQTSRGGIELIIPNKKIKTEQDGDQGNQQQMQIGGDTEALAVINPALGKYLCQTPGCGKRFKKSCNLKDHERAHSGVKPFACKYPGCSHASIKRSNTIDHIRTIHLKNLKPDGQEAPDPKVYLEVKQELLN